MKGVSASRALLSFYGKQTASSDHRFIQTIFRTLKQHPQIRTLTYYSNTPRLNTLQAANKFFSTMDDSNTAGDSFDQQRDRKSTHKDGKTASLSRDNTSNSSSTANPSLKSNDRNHTATTHQYIEDKASESNQAHHYHTNLSVSKTKDRYDPSDQEQNRNTIIASVERPLPSTNPPQVTSPTPVKQSSNNNSTPVYNSYGPSTFPVIISRLQELQSPRSQPTEQDSPITQVTKSRHRGFLSQLLCCFRPASSNICHYSISIYNNTDVSQHHNTLNQKYSGKYLLPARKPSDNRICLVIDLDETLVHSSFKPIENADFIVPVEIDGTLHKVYVLKRPHVDEFLKKMGQIYECVLFTASLSKYADPVADLLDTENIFKARLFRESCAFYRGNYVKDLSRLGRDLNRVIIVDNSPASYIFHPDNAVSMGFEYYLPSLISLSPY